MDNSGNNENKKIIALVAVVLVVGLLLGVVVSAPKARANAITDFFSNLFAPFGAPRAGTSMAAASVFDRFPVSARGGL